MGILTRPIHRAIAAAATLTGKRFGLLVASSLVATSAIVASAATTPGGNGPLAALLSRSLAAESAPVAVAPELAPSPEPSVAATPSPAGPAEAEAAPVVSQESSAAPETSGPKTESETPEVPATPEVATPEAGRIKHVFVISLASPGYEAAFGSASQMPYLSTTLRPQGDLLSGYSLLGSAGLPNALAAVSGQPPNPSTKADCSTYSEFAGAEIDKRGVVSGSGCVYPVEALTLPDQLGVGRFSWHAYIDGMVDPETGKPANCVSPEAEALDQPAVGAYAARQNPFVYFHSLLDLGDCTTNDVPLTELSKDLGKATSTANYSYIAPPPPTRKTGCWSSPSMSSTRLKRARSHRRRKPSPRSAPCSCPASSRPTRPTPLHMTPTRCCARPRISSASRRWRPRAAPRSGPSPRRCSAKTEAIEQRGRSAAQALR
jgi:hypothetical protein